MRRTYYIILFFFLISYISPSNGQNLAKSKKYTFSEEPNYSLTNGSDDLDLTDGRKKTGAHFWTDKTTVGWNRKQEIRIELDLGDVYSINEFLINTARGQSAEVEFPLNCLVFTSLDNNLFEYHGDLMFTGDNSSGNYKVQSFYLKDTKSLGRYVKFVLTTKGKYLFLDEIEVYGVKAKHTVKAKDNLIKKSDLEVFINNALKESVYIRNHKMYMTSAENYLGDFMSKDKIFSIENQPANNLKRIQLEVNNHIKKTQSKTLQNDIIFTPISSFDNLEKFSLNAIIENQKKTNKSFLINEESTLYYFSLLNNKQRRESITFQFTNDLNHTVYEFLPVMSMNKIKINDALKPVTNNLVNIEAGENKFFVIPMFQLNENNGSIQIVATEKKDFIEKLIFKNSIVKPYNQNEKLNVNVWAYLDKPVIRNNINFVINDLENSDVNVIVVHSAFIDGYNTKNFSNLKKYLRNFKNTEDKKILLFYNFKTNPEKKFNGKTFLDMNWKNNFSKWYKLLQRELSSVGINKNEIYFYPYDEINPNEVNNFIELVKWGKTSIPNFKTFVTIDNEKSLEAGNFSDIVQIHEIHLNKIQNINNKNIWVYSVLDHSRDRDPYKDYRLLSWYAYFYGLKGVGFWNYSALQSENEAYYNKIINGNIDYSVLYLDDNGEVLQSLRWLCFRQGLKDYQTLKTYEELIGKDKVKNVVKDVVDNPDNLKKADEALKILSKSL